MHDNRQILMQRVERTLREKILPAQHTILTPLNLSFWRVPRENNNSGLGTNSSVIGEPVALNSVPWESFTPITAGTSWGAPWETVWFSINTTIPNRELETNDVFEAIVDLGWADHSAGFQCEGQVRDSNGHCIKAINPRNQWIPLPQVAGTEVQFSIEAAANPLLLEVLPFQPTYDGDKLTSSLEDLYTLTRADLTIRHGDVYDLALDISVLFELIQAQPHFGDREWHVLHTLNCALDALELDDIPRTAHLAREILAPELAKPALPHAHRLSAVGHAHIDSAWLWPIRETKRKVVRTLSNVVRLIEDGTGLVFALPAAQHLAWVKEQDPELFDRIRTCVKEGSIVPVGGMWVEPDAVLPGGEAMCRQLVEGISFFRQELDFDCKEVWLPDSFGYSGALPQIAKEAGIERFLTQKISWNQVDTFPHHTLAWEGIDGSRIFTHFPPADTYGSEVTGAQLVHAVENFKEKGKASCSLLPFGYGDGGGGPTREMMARLHRFSDLEGAPRTVVESPHDFFERAKEEYTELPVWVGELYLELHRGTFTSQIDAKQGNRRNEALLREAELWCTTAATRGKMDYPYDDLQAAWHKLLLCQFHDILPGTSVAWVYREVRELHAQISTTCENLIKEALTSLGVSLTDPNSDDAASRPASDSRVLINAASFKTHSVEALSISAPQSLHSHITVDHNARSVSTEFFTVKFDESGCCVSMRNTQGFDYIPRGQRAGELHLHQDFPNMWDAWDIDPFYRGSQRTVTNMHLEKIEELDDCVRITADAAFDSSRVTLEWLVYNDHVDLHVEADWNEQEKILKLVFPTNIHTDRAQYETQMGFIERATHENTSWDAYRFEVSTHRWLRVANASQSLTIANDSTYGWDITRHPHEQRGTWSAIRATLIKSAKYPDPQQDQGVHSWNFRILPNANVLRAVQEGQNLNLGRRFGIGSTVESLIGVDGAVVESVSMAPDRSGDVVVRLYEAQGGPQTVQLSIPDASNVRCTNLLYEDTNDVPTVSHQEGDSYSLTLGAFQVATLRFSVEEQ
ncbi:alpha-mannosidase [Arcanobacterium ihumii]|uniref:alpha-mannosidase n=1 Tax=Arcanobacterium ihumii TaxID=2138162 RepID=UPI000F534B2D|nr:alpha-mannosidase [Arcanobacterium ihumii]